MATERQKNPYEILRLKTTATVNEVVERAKDMMMETSRKEVQLSFQRAASDIRQHPVKQASFQFWEPFETVYDDDTLDRFVRKHKNCPIDVKEVENRVERFLNEDCRGCKLLPTMLPAPRPFERTAAVSVPAFPATQVSFPLDTWELYS